MNNSRVINGNRGGIYIGDTNPAAPAAPNLVFAAFEALEDSVLASGTVCNVTGLAASGKTIKAGVIIYGRYSSITLASGSGIAYHL